MGVYYFKYISLTRNESQKAVSGGGPVYATMLHLSRASTPNHEHRRHTLPCHFTRGRRSGHARAHSLAHAHAGVYDAGCDARGAYYTCRGNFKRATQARPACASDVMCSTADITSHHNFASHRVVVVTSCHRRGTRASPSSNPPTPTAG